MMDPTKKADWVEALREGTREQGKGTLRDIDGKQCCLDVLCEIAVEQGVIPAPILAEDGAWYSYEDMYGDKETIQSEVLPCAVKEWAGLTLSDPAIPTRVAGSGAGAAVTLSALNDNYGYTFEEIADAIEASDL